MKIYKENEKSTELCDKCRKTVKTTFKYAPYEYGDAMIPDVMQEFCDECGDVVSLPHQSAGKIRQYNDEAKKAFELRVPKHFVDVLINIGYNHRISVKHDLIFRMIIEFYLNQMKGDFKKYADKINAALKDSLSEGKSESRLSCRLPVGDIYSNRMFSKKLGTNKSNFARGMIIAAKRDLLDREDAEINKEFDLFVTTMR